MKKTSKDSTLGTFFSRLFYRLFYFLIMGPLGVFFLFNLSNVEGLGKIPTAVGGLVFQSTTFSLPKIFDERLGELAVTATSVGSFAFVVFALASVGQLIVGYLLDRVSLKLVFLVVAAIQAVFFTLMVGATGSVALAVSAVFMLAVFGQIPINDVLLGRITRSEWRSRVFGLRYIVTFSVSASSIPLIAWIYALWGFDALFWVLTVAALTILIAVALLPAAAAQPKSVA
jgi:MFS family permease